jgi:hypothetical protein
MGDTCTHEAGHAVMCWYWEVPIATVTAERQSDDVQGQIGHSNPLFGIGGDPCPLDLDIGELDALACHTCVLISLAGAEACRVAGDTDPTEGDNDDVEKAFDVCSRISRSDEEAQALMAWLRLRAFGILSQAGVWPAVVALADRLRSERTLTGEAAKAAILGAFKATPGGAETPTSA